MSGQPATPGQRAYEAHAAMVVPRPWRWDQLDDKLRAAWDAAAQAVLNDAFPGLKRELAEAQARLDTSRELHRLSRLSAAGDESELRHIHETLTIAYGREDLSEETATVVEAMAAERGRYRRALEAIRDGDNGNVADSRSLAIAREALGGGAVSRAYCCEACGDADPRWQLGRRGDAVIAWACEADLSVVIGRLQRDREVTTVSVTDIRKARARAALGGDHA